MKRKLNHLRKHKRSNVILRLLYLICFLVLTQFYCSVSSYGQSRYGATLPYTQYESEDASIVGAALKQASSSIQSDIASEASNQKYVSLTSAGSYLQWKVKQSVNFVRVRFTMPEAVVGKVLKASLDVYVNGSKVKTVEVTSHWMGPKRNFDEVHFKLPKSITSGDVLKIQSSGGPTVGIDFILLEAAPAPTAMPAGFTNVTAYGAIANDGGNDLAAFNAAYAAATVGVYIPAGTFNLSSIWQCNRNGIKIQGEGIASTTLFFTSAGTMNSGILAVTSGTEISNFYMNTVNTTRDGSPGKGIMGTYGTGSNIHNLEIHHFECGAWIGGYSSPLQVTQNMIFQNNRIIDNWADGINLCQGTSNCTITNNYFSGNWDDGIALWPNNEYSAPMEVNNIISYNTVENNKRAGGIAIFGGNGHQVFNNLVQNSTACSGIRFTTDFPGYHFENTTLIRVYNNNFTNVGCNVDYWGCSRGAIEFDATGYPIQNITFDNNTITNSQRHAVQIGSTNTVSNIVFNNLTVNGVGTSGATNSCFTIAIPSCVIMTYGNNGNATFNNLCISNVPSSQYVYQSNPTGFRLTVSYGCGNTVPVTGVSVSPTSATKAVGTTQQLTATVSPSTATDKTVTWTSSNTAVATVNTSGLVTAVAAGTATITVRTNNGGFTATSTITVTSTSVPVTGVTVSPTSASIAVGATTQLTATVSPTNATDKTVTWTSSNTAAATVNVNGLVSGVAAGSSVITVRTNTGGFTATSTITVTSVPQTPYAGNIAIPGILEAENYDNGGEGVAYHDNETANNGGQYRTGNGVDIEACSEGGYNVGWTIVGEWLEYTVNVATAGTYTADVRVATATGGSFHIEFGGVDKTGVLTVPVTGGWQTWQSVTRTGMALSAGIQIMRIYMNGADFNINRVTFTGGGTTIPVTGVTVSPTSAAKTVGTTQQLTATVSPTNATDKTVTWTSSNTAVATVNASGLVNCIAAGTATITVRTNNGGFTANSTITITGTSVPVTGVTVSPTSASIGAGTSQQLTATVAPSNATDKTVTWTSSNTAVATVNASGLVSGVVAGTAIITVRTNNGGFTATSAITVTGSGLTYYRIRNRWQNTYLTDGGANAAYSVLPATPGLIYEWIREDVGSGQFELKNASTGEYMHIENQTGTIQCTARTSGWASSRWTTEATDNGWVRLKNVWQPTQYIHVENLTGFAQHGTINAAWLSAQWLFEAVAKSAAEEMASEPIAEVSYRPNPVVDELNIQFNGNSFSSLTVLDISGRICFVQNIDPYQTESVIDFSSLKQGIYFIQLKNNASVQIFKIVKGE